MNCNVASTIVNTKDSFMARTLMEYERFGQARKRGASRSRRATLAAGPSASLHVYFPLSTPQKPGKTCGLEKKNRFHI